MNKVILLRYGEIHLKGNNRGYFENALLNNLKKSLKEINAKVKMSGSRYIISDYDESLENEILERAKCVFGFVSLSRAVELATDVDEIKKYCASIKIKTDTFKVETRRADKTFPIESPMFNAEIGGIILDNNTQCKVDIHNPQTEVEIDIRENKKTYVFFERIEGLGGIPVSTSGLGTLLLSGGIDSPVAGFLMAKRGLSINAVYFHSFPYTSEQAKNKVINLAQKLTKYCGNIKLFIVPFTKIQEEINACCDREFMITIMRRFMMRIAEKIAIDNKSGCLITGENLGQVASQTVEGITTSNSVLKNLPMFRPLIAYDKVETMKIARQINTFEISNLPYEDCCTAFVPKNPIIHPTVEKCEEQEKKILNLDELIQNAISGIEIINLEQ